jgi:hypothetical protein
MKNSSYEIPQRTCGRDTDTIPLIAEVLSLPDMQGTGMVRDLRQAANDQSTRKAA